VFSIFSFSKKVTPAFDLGEDIKDFLPVVNESILIPPMKMEIISSKSDNFIVGNIFSYNPDIKEISNDLCLIFRIGNLFFFKDKEGKEVKAVYNEF